VEVDAMANNFKKQSLLSVILLSIITLGIYIPFWFKKIKKVTDTFPTKELSRIKIMVLMITSFLAPIFSFTLSISVNNIEKVYSTNFYGIGYILNILRGLLIIFLSFNLRSILQKQFNVKLNGVLTFFLGPIYLQYKINSLVDKGTSLSERGITKQAYQA